LGIVSQDNNLDDELTVYENLDMFGRFYALTRVERRRRIAALLDFLELTPKADALIAGLSGGMKRRLVIARALLHAPEFLFLDEPTTGLDPQVRRLLWGVVRELIGRGLSVLLTTHYMEEAAQLAGRVVIMDRGQKVDEGSPKDLIRRCLPAHALEFAIRPNETAESLKRETSAARVEIGDGWCRLYDDDATRLFALERRFAEREPRRRPTDLEDVFLCMTGRRLDE
jgi:lipooligosaccharide transport system ATP-binding protein